MIIRNASTRIFGKTTPVGNSRTVHAACRIAVLFTLATIAQGCPMGENRGASGGGSTYAVVEAKQYVDPMEKALKAKPAVKPTPGPTPERLPGPPAPTARM